MDAIVYRDSGEFMISLRVDGHEVDVAGPFDDEHDAVCAAMRAGSVLFAGFVRISHEVT